MPADRLLNQLLALYQTVHDDAQTDRIFGTTLSLLTELSNPLNLSLLTSQFLHAPAIWHQSHAPDPLRSICLRVLGVYNTAAIHVRRNELENEDREAQSAKLQELIRRGTPRDLAQAQELMKSLAGANPDAKPDYRTQALTELNKLESKVILLNEMLDNVDTERGERFAQGDVYDVSRGNLCCQLCAYG